MKNPKIIISEGDVVGNKGAVAMVYSIIQGIREEYPNAEFIVTSKFIKDRDYLDDKKIKLIYDNEQAFDIPLLKLWFWWLLKNVGINLQFILKDKTLSIYKDADLVISASGISFHDSFGLIKIYHFSKYMQIPLFLDKRIIKFTQSIGPFESNYNKLMARLVLPKIDFVFGRGKHSENNLYSIGVKENVKSFPDIAMTMEPQRSSTIDEILEKYKDKVIIGISPNIVCKQLDTSNTYLGDLKELSEYILQKYDDVVLLFIPHTIVKEDLKKEDDYSICKYLHKNIKKKNRSETVNTLDFSPEETKYLISRCDFFVGSRFHSLIASVSSCVPSIAIGWHWKYEEMMQWVEIENNVIQYWDLTKDKLINLFEKNFNERNEIKKKMEIVVPQVKRKAKEAIEKINGIIDEMD